MLSMDTLLFSSLCSVFRYAVWQCILQSWCGWCIPSCSHTYTHKHKRKHTCLYISKKADCRGFVHLEYPSLSRPSLYQCWDRSWGCTVAVHQFVVLTLAFVILSTPWCCNLYGLLMPPHLCTYHPLLHPDTAAPSSHNTPHHRLFITLTSGFHNR